MGLIIIYKINELQIINNCTISWSILYGIGPKYQIE